MRGIEAGDRGVLARAVTLVESTRPADQAVTEELLAKLAPRTGAAMRIGISGPPGAGKSTLIDALGTHALDVGKRVAVLAIDPSSTTTGGSILGDKTRMPHLTSDARAFVRPSPASGHYGGVAPRTREAMLVCEAFGFDVVIVETVGVGQSEAQVAAMVDTFLLLALPNAGDELQGIKRGIMEAADIVAVTKADGSNVAAARTAVRDLTAALRLMRRRSQAWRPQACSVSALAQLGISELWALLVEHRRALQDSNGLESLRRSQLKEWLWSEVRRRLASELERDQEVHARAVALEEAAARGESSVLGAARAIVELFRGH